MSEPAFTGEGFTITRLVTEPLDNNVYIVCDEATATALVVDPSSGTDRIVEATNGMEVIAVAITHGHADHHGAANDVARRFEVPIHLHPADLEIAGLAGTQPYPDGPLRVGNTEIAVVHTPGHTLGSVSLLLEGVALAGDTLFPGGPGATGSPYSDFDQIIASIERELFALPTETVVLPGHGAATTVGTEIGQLQDWIDRRW